MTFDDGVSGDGTAQVAADRAARAHRSRLVDTSRVGRHTHLFSPEGSDSMRLAPLAFAAVLLAVAADSSASGPPAIDYGETFQWLGYHRPENAYLNPVAADGHRLYFVWRGRDHRDHLWVEDIRDPKRPRALHRETTFPDRPSDVVPVGERLYLGVDGTLRIREWIGDELVERSALDVPGLRSIHPHGDRLALIRQESIAHYELILLDVSDPAAPVEDGRVWLPSDYVRTGDLRDDEMFVFGSSQIWVYDLSDPSSPALRRTIQLPPIEFARSWVVDGDVAYRSEGYGVSSFDLNALGSTPPRLDRIAFPFWSSNLQLVGSTLWIGASPGVHIVDISDPTAMRVEEVIETGSGRAFSAGDRTFLRVVGVAQVERRDRPNPDYLGTWPGGPVSDLEVDGTTVFATIERSLRVIDASDPLALQESAAVDVQFLARRVSVHEGLAVVVANSNLLVVDVSVPDSPVERARFWGSFGDVVVADGHAFIVRKEGGLAVLELGDGTSIRIVREIPAIAEDALLVRHGSLLFVTDAAAVRVLDISAPDVPLEIARHSLADPGSTSRGSPLSLTTDGERLAVVLPDGTVLLLRLDVSAGPIEVDRVALPGGRSAVVHDGQLYVAGAPIGVSVCDWTDPAQPGAWVNFHRNLTGDAMVAAGGALLVADQLLPGLRVVPRHEAPGAALPTSAGGPDPSIGAGLRFARITRNPTTGGASWSLRLDGAGLVRGDVFDVRGRLVASLPEPSAASAATRITWDGRSDRHRPVPAGVYFVVFRSGGASATDRVVVVR
jgi:hypothetical protein